MPNIQDIKKLISNDLNNSSIGEACLNICGFIEKTKRNQLQHIDYSTLLKESCSPTDDVLFQAIQYLSGSRTHLLEANYELFIDEYPVQVEKSDIIEAENSGLFAHPETGILIPNYESFIEIYFNVSNTIVDLK